MSKSRKQAWLKDELVLALNLYFEEGKSADLDARKRLSGLLREIPIEQELTKDPRFRGEKAVSHKLHNFVHLDPSDPADGFPKGGKGDREVWKQYSKDREGLSRAAAAIEAIILAEEGLGVSLPDNEDGFEEAPEGVLLTRQHTYRERNRKLVRKKKDRALAEAGQLACEVCNFTFASKYGSHGEGFIECHHTIPISQLNPGQKTKLSDLALVCADCHRMIHHRTPWLTLDELKKIIDNPS